MVIALDVVVDHDVTLRGRDAPGERGEIGL